MAIQLHVERRGAGPPILFAHSFAGDTSHWSATMAHLGLEYRAVAFDFSAHGRTPATPGKYSIASLANDIDAAAAKERLGSFILVGHSLGALAAAEYAGSNPARVRALVLVDAPPAPGAIPPNQLQQMFAELDRDPFPVIEQFWDQQMFVDARAETTTQLLAALHAMPPDAAAALTKVSLDYDARPALRRYTGPKFAIVTPRNDSPSSLHHAVPGFRHVTIPGTSHWIHLDEPAKFNAALDGLLAEIGAGSASLTSGTPRYPPPAAP